MRQILVFVLLSGILCWLMFAPIYKHVVIVRHALLEQEVDYLLEIAANGDHGHVGATMLEDSKARLETRGFDVAKLTYEIESTTGADATNPASPIPRGEGIYLSISYPMGHVFVLDRLIGVTGPAATDRMIASGMKMSEYVP